MNLFGLGNELRRRLKGFRRSKHHVRYRKVTIIETFRCTTSYSSNLRTSNRAGSSSYISRRRTDGPRADNATQNAKSFETLRRRCQSKNTVTSNVAVRQAPRQKHVTTMTLTFSCSRNASYLLSSIVPSYHHIILSSSYHSLVVSIFSFIANDTSTF
jgi:hypothetical protein